MARNADPQAYNLREISVDKLPPGLLTGLKRSASAGTLQAKTLQKEGSEVWILQCPKDVKLTPLLEGKKLRLDESQSEVFYSEEDGKKYESSCIPLNESNSESIATIVPDESGNMNLISVPLAGHIMIREAFEELPLPTISTVPRKQRKHQLPSGIKERHPIYGVNFSKAIASMSNSSNSDSYQNKASKTNVSRKLGNHEQKQNNQRRNNEIQIESLSPTKMKKKK